MDIAVSSRLCHEPISMRHPAVVIANRYDNNNFTS